MKLKRNENFKKEIINENLKKIVLSIKLHRVDVCNLFI